MSQRWFCGGPSPSLRPTFHWNFHSLKAFLGPFIRTTAFCVDPRSSSPWRQMPLHRAQRFWCNDNFCLVVKTVAAAAEIVVPVENEFSNDKENGQHLADRTPKRTDRNDRTTGNVCVCWFFSQVAGTFLSGQCLAVHGPTVVGETVQTAVAPVMSMLT